MRRIAFFVEGCSEMLFVEKLIHEIAGKNNVVIERGYIRGGNRIPKKLQIFSGKGITTGCLYYVLILNCQGDHQVVSRIMEEHLSFLQNGYEKIIGIRDVRPDFLRSEISALRNSVSSILGGLPIATDMVLSEMEIEAIFLAETSHFQKISPAITVETIKNRLGFDPMTQDMQLRDDPATDLGNCYAIGGRTYMKQAVQDTIDALDFDRIYLEFPKKNNSVAQLVSSIDSFLTPLNSDALRA